MSFPKAHNSPDTQTLFQESQGETFPPSQAGWAKSDPLPSARSCFSPVWLDHFSGGRWKLVTVTLLETGPTELSKKSLGVPFVAQQ